MACQIGGIGLARRLRLFTGTAFVLVHAFQRTEQDYALPVTVEVCERVSALATGGAVVPPTRGRCYSGGGHKPYLSERRGSATSFDVFTFPVIQHPLDHHARRSGCDNHVGELRRVTGFRRDWPKVKRGAV